MRSAETTRVHRFLSARPTDLRTAPPWHRLSYIVRTLPRELRRLSTRLEVPGGGRVLDFGCAEQPYRDFFPATTEFVGADLPGNPHASVEIREDGSVEVASERFDAVLSTQVLEHVADPATYLSECFRVLRPGGRLLLSTHGTMVWHPDPVDYWRWTCDGLRVAVEQAGFEIEHFEGIMGLASTGIQQVQDAVYYKVPGFLRPVLALCTQTLIALADRMTGTESRNMNALVFAVVAGKP